MTKNAFLWLPLAFIAGGLVGAWGPSKELSALRKRGANEEKPSRNARVFDDFAKMVNIPETAKRRRPTPPSATDTPAHAKMREAAKDSSAAEDKRPKSAPGRFDPEDLKARIEEASELWRTRCELAFAGTVKKLRLDADGEARFESALVRMNDEIRSSVQAIADALVEEEELTPELAVRLMGDFSTTLAETYDRLGECAGESLRGEISKLNLADFVDPSVAEPLIGVQHKLDRFPARRPQR